jgi:ABC-type nitrate/sulfonate/bicarbonate transport system substrate-binding protein
MSDCPRLAIGTFALRSRERARAWLIGFGLSVTVVVLGTACRNADASRHGRAPTEATELLELRYLAVPGTVSPPELAEELGYLAPVKLLYVSSTNSGPQSIQTAVTGDVDFGSAFNGAILKLIAAKAPITAVVGSYGVDDLIWGGYYVTEDSPVKTARDLIGKTVAVNTVGAHQEFVLKEYLGRNGLSQDEIKQVTLVALPPINAEQALRQGQTDVAVLTSIFRDRAVERGGLRLLVSDRELFGSFTAGSYVMRNDFIAKHPKTAKKFVEAVGKAIEWSKTTPREQVLERFRKVIAKRKRNEDTSVVSYWHSYGVADPRGRIQPKEFQIWIDWMLRTGELRPGQVELTRVYTNALNPP